MISIDVGSNTNHLYDGEPYSVHLSMVAMFAKKYIDCISSESQNDVLFACWLHDTIEDCRLTYNDIKEVAGETVANIVYAVTNEKGKTRKERANDVYYEGIRQTRYAVYVKLCDRLANVQYSLDNNSRMYSVYQNENHAFLEALLPNGSELYQDIVKELKMLLARL